MASALIYLFVVLAVAAVAYLLASLVFGRGEQLAPLPPGSTPTRLPPADIEGADVRALRFQQVLRGYKASEVDWALERLAGELDELHGRIAVLERQLDAAGEQLQEARAGHPDEPEG
ncbi:DivIVA domain-containing protein [Saccharopolyspora elongata]|uniref:DivIVA domain-containing protein n=1 Tax=Saccharopolyspora elongata TaxID=2530387 RepID=A0A4R4Z954_9PSEU|nr:DivIVA domain-containing protein [Saccharopolyspora elongata]TDD53649.1 DivIVA domain-containing protein [Saccharopolyspora elongata]